MNNEKKSKKNRSSGAPSHKTLEKMRRERHNLDTVAAALALVVVLSVLACHGQTVRLETADTEGFPMWFLLFTSYPALGFLSLLRMMAGAETGGMLAAVLETRPAWLLGIVDLGFLAAVWFFARVHVMKRYGAATVRIWANFLLIILIWGGIQLGCCFAGELWNSGGFSVLHRGRPAAASPGTPDAPEFGENRASGS